MSFSRIICSPLGIVFLLLCCGLFIPFHISVDRIFWQRVLDAGHFPALGLFAFVLALFFTRPGSVQPVILYVRTFVMVTVFAGLAEGLQLLVGRSAQWDDFWRGAAGAAMGALGAYFVRRPPPRRVLVEYVLVGIATMALFCLPAYEKWQALRLRDSLFPVLAEFSDPRELVLWRAYGEKEEVATQIDVVKNLYAKDSFALRVRTATNEYTGIRYQSAEHSWASYTTLKVQIINPGGEFHLALRIDDDKPATDYDQRFNRTELIAPGVSTISIPIRDIILSPRGRKLDVSQIQQLLLFVPPSAETKEFYIDTIWLE